jgi:hypothetical protein
MFGSSIELFRTFFAALPALSKSLTTLIPSMPVCNNPKPINACMPQYKQISEINLTYVPDGELAHKPLRFHCDLEKPFVGLVTL